MYSIDLQHQFSNGGKRGQMAILSNKSFGAQARSRLLSAAGGCCVLSGLLVGERKTCRGVRRRTIPLEGQEKLENALKHTDGCTQGRDKYDRAILFNCELTVNALEDVHKSQTKVISPKPNAVFIQYSDEERRFASWNPWLSI